ncbi:hypothetical protein [Thermocatellispora tengchongensis]|uniref:hypothetical protein n=1 Tax=Thermocatellispora tengchongensis TaxID=1073253 RepID=UPI003627CFA7
MSAARAVSGAPVQACATQPYGPNSAGKNAPASGSGASTASAYASQIATVRHRPRRFQAPNPASAAITAVIIATSAAVMPGRAYAA